MPALQERISIENIELAFYPAFYKEAEARNLFRDLRDEIDWKHQKINVFGKEYRQPRLTNFYAENDFSYTYSNLKMQPEAFNGTLERVKRKVDDRTEVHFTSCW